MKVCAMCLALQVIMASRRHLFSDNNGRLKALKGGGMNVIASQTLVIDTMNNPAVFFFQDYPQTHPRRLIDHLDR